MKTKEQILAWLGEQPWKYEFYEAAFLSKMDDKIEYNENFIAKAFYWAGTTQGKNVWISRETEYLKWYHSTDKFHSWKEYCKKNPIKRTDCFITDNCQILHMPIKRARIPDSDINVMPEEHCEAFVAYMKLFQLRNAWVKDCDDVNMNYRIIASNGKIDIPYCYDPKMGLSFPTQEMADEFAEVFKDLLETAKPVL